jgi:methionyl-tRNA synthetase
MPADTAGEFDSDLISLAEKTVGYVDTCMEQFRISDALSAVIGLARRCNKYIDETLPWVLAKEQANYPRLCTVLYNLLECIRIIAVLLTPFMPETSEAILMQLNTGENSYESIKTFGGLKSGEKVGIPTPLFSRIVKQ